MHSNYHKLVLFLIICLLAAGSTQPVYAASIASGISQESAINQVLIGLSSGYLFQDVYPTPGTDTPVPTIAPTTPSPTSPTVTQSGTTPVSTQAKTPTPSGTSETTATATPTTTLMPLPLITLIYPVTQTTPTPISSPSPFPPSQTPKPLSDFVLAVASPRVKALTVVVVILWLILAVFLGFYFRQFR